MWRIYYDILQARGVETPDSAVDGYRDKIRRKVYVGLEIVLDKDDVFMFVDRSTPRPRIVTYVRAE